jgi:hypothetical protein
MTLGDFDTGTVVYFKFTTYNPSTGAPFTLAGTPAISVYKDNSVTQSTTGVTLTVDFDAVTGLHHVAVDTSADGTFYAAGSFFDVVITTGTVNAVSAVGTVVGRFTLRKTSALKPTTAGRTLDVSAGGEAGVDWSNVGSPTTSVDLTNTTINIASGSRATLVDEVWDEVLTGASHNVVNSAGRRLRQVDASFVITAGTAQAGTASSITLAAGASATNDIYKHDGLIIVGGTGIGESAIITAYDGATKVATVAPAFVITPDATSEYEIVPAIACVHSIGDNVITAASTAADFVTEVQSGLASQTSVNTIDDFLDTEIAAIKAVTDALPNAGALTTIQSDLDDIQTRLPAALVGGRMDANMGAISGSATAADNLEAGGLGLVPGTCSTGSTTTSIVTNLTEATDDHYNGRVITFTSGALLGQTTSISDYVGATKTLTVVALTEAPANTDSFIIS